MLVVVRSLGFPIRRAVFLIFMVSITTGIALSRVILIVIENSLPSNDSEHSGVNLAYIILSDLEPYLTLIIVTFPAMRAVFRSTSEEKKEQA